MKYQIGDKVLVKRGLRGGEHYDGLYFNRSMKRFCYTIQEIANIELDCYVFVDGEGWHFNDEMILCKIEENEDVKVSKGECEPSKDEAKHFVVKVTQSALQPFLDTIQNKSFYITISNFEDGTFLVSYSC